MTTIRDIAKKANVAVSTVSYVLNNTKSVKAETKERILAAMQELNYQPSQIARSLKTKRTDTIGLLIPDCSEPYFAEIAKGVEEAARQRGYHLLLMNTDDQEELEKTAWKRLCDRGIDGVLAVGTGKNRRLFQQESERMPTVAVGRSWGKQVNSVAVNYVEAGRLATQYLVNRFDSEVLLITGPLVEGRFFDCMTGYVMALKEKGFAHDESLIYVCEAVHAAEGELAIRQLLADGVKPRTIFAADDVLALGVLRELLRQGIRVPDEIAVAGCGDHAAAALVFPALTTVRLPGRELGEQAVEALLEQLEGERREPCQTELTPELVIRETT